MPVYSGDYSMKKFNKIKCFSYVFTVILALGFVLTACEKPAVTLTTPESVNGFKLNTFVQIDSYTSVSKNTLTEALNLCDYYENIFSRTKEDSELSKVNSNQTTSISKEMYELVSAGLEYAALSNGAFDITIGSVSRLWDFTAESPKVPDSGRIAEALTHVDYTRVSVSDNGDGTYLISKPDDVILDLGAVAKGYIADKIKDFLEEMKTVAQESYRVLKKDKFCAVLMGDTRQKGHMIPISFDVMRVFEDAGFKLKELIIKEQHNCKATGYWKTNSVKYNFLLIAHEYLFVFRK